MRRVSPIDHSGAAVTTPCVLCHAIGVTAESGTRTWNGSGNPNPSDPSATPTSSHVPELVLCALDESLAQAWHTVADAVGDPVRVHRGSVLDIAAQAAAEGIWDLRRSGLEKAKTGITSLDEVNQCTVE